MPNPDNKGNVSLAFVLKEIIKLQDEIKREHEQLKPRWFSFSSVQQSRLLVAQSNILVKFSQQLVLAVRENLRVALEQFDKEKQA